MRHTTRPEFLQPTEEAIEGSPYEVQDESVELALHLSQQQFTGRGGNFQRQIEQYNGWSYIGINAKAMAAASAKPVIYDDRINQDEVTDDEEDTKERADNKFRWWSLLRKPSPWQSGGQLRWEVMQQLGIHGMSIVWNVRNGFGKTMWRIPIPMALVTPIAPGSQRGMPYGGVRVHTLQWIHRYFAYPIQQIERFDFLASRTISLQDITLTAFPHPFLRGDGFSPLTAGDRWASLVESAEKAQAGQYSRGPMRKFLMKMPQEATATTATADAWQRKMDARLRDTETGVIGVAHDFAGQEVTIDPDQMMYIETIQTLGPALMALHGTPKSVVGLSENMTYGSNAAAMQAFVTNGLKPALDLMAAEDTATMQKEEGPAFTIEYEPPSFRDPELELQELTTDISAGAITLGEYRKKRGYRPLGDERDDMLVGSAELASYGQQPGMMPGMPGVPGAPPAPGAPAMPPMAAGPKPPGSPPAPAAAKPPAAPKQPSPASPESEEKAFPTLLRRGARATQPQAKSFAIGDQAAMLMPPVIAFDLDGTLAQDYGDEFDPMLIGEPRPEIVSILRTLKAVGCVVVLYTVRGPESYPAIVEWLTRNDIPWDGINENPLFGQNLESKMMFDVLIDDRAVNSRTPEGVILQSVITQIDPMFGEMIRQEMMSQRTSRYGFLMAPLAGRMADEIRPLQKLIDPADLAGDGLVRDLHITILANIMDRDRDSIARVMSSVARAPFRMAKGVTVFDEVSPGVSALVVEIQGDAVPVLHEVAARSFSHLETFKTYRPHVTLGYVKSEAVDRYVTMQIPNIGSTVETLSFVAPGEPELIIPLRG